MGNFKRTWKFAKYLWEYWLVKAGSVLLGIIGSLQVIATLLPKNYLGDSVNYVWWQQLAIFLVTPWVWYWWVIIILGFAVTALAIGLWRLGGFDFELKISIYSKPLIHTESRHVGISFTNNSPRVISQISVVVKNLISLSDSNWKPDPLINRNDRLLWSSWYEPRTGVKEIVPGFEVVSDLMFMVDGLDFCIIDIHAGRNYLYVPRGSYQIDLEMRGVYSGRRVDVPLSLIFDYGGSMQLNSMSLNDKGTDQRIERPVMIEIMPSSLEPEDLLQKAVEKLNKSKAKKKNGRLSRAPKANKTHRRRSMARQKESV